MADVKVGIQRATVPSSTGLFDITIAGFGTPKAAIFLYYRDTGATGSPNRQDIYMGYGFTDGLGQHASMASWNDNATSSAGRRAQSGSKVAILEQSGANDVAFSTWITDGVRLAVSNGAALSGCRLDVVFFTGDNVQAAAGTLQTAGAVGAASSVAGLPFQPELIFGATAGINNTTNQTNGIISFGVAYDDPVAGIVQAMLGRGTASNRTGVMRRSDGLVGQPFTTGTALWRGEVTAFNPDGFDLTIRDQASGTDFIGYLCLNLGGKGVKLEPNYGTPISLGPATVPASFTPQFFMGHFSRRTTPANVSETASPDGEAIGHALVDQSQELYNQTQFDDNVATTVLQVLRSDKTLRLFTDLTNDTTPNDDVLAEAVFSSFTPAGTELDYTTVSGGVAGESYYGWTLQIEQDQAAGNVADTATAADNWSGNVTTSESLDDGLRAGETKEGSAIVTATVVEGKVAGSVAVYEAQLYGSISEGQAASEAWSANAELTLSFQGGLHAGDATWAAAEVHVAISESTLAGDLPAGSNLVLAQIIEDALAGQLAIGTVTYQVEISDGAAASDASTRFQTLLAQVLETSLAGESQTAITVVLDFVRIANVVGATSRINGLTGAASRANKPLGRRSQVTNLQGVTP